jgi:hypothetical protein
MPSTSRHRRVVRQVRDSRQLVRPAEDPADKAQRRVHRVVGVGTGRRMRQHRRAAAPAGLASVMKPRPHRQSPVRGQPLVGEADPHRLHPVFGAQIQPHRLVRLRREALTSSVSCTPPTTPNGALCWRSQLQLHESGLAWMGLGRLRPMLVSIPKGIERLRSIKSQQIRSKRSK